MKETRETNKERAKLNRWVVALAEGLIFLLCLIAGYTLLLVLDGLL